MLLEVLKTESIPLTTVSTVLYILGILHSNRVIELCVGKSDQDLNNKAQRSDDDLSRVVVKDKLFGINLEEADSKLNQQPQPRNVSNVHQQSQTEPKISLQQSSNEEYRSPEM